MKTRKFTAIILAAIMLLALLTGCGGGSASEPSPGVSGSAATNPGASPAGSSGASSSGEKLVLKLSHNAAVGQTIDVGCEKFAADILEKTSGRVEIQVFPNNILGSEVATRDMIKDGSVDMVAMGGPSLSTYTGVIDLTNMLYLWESEDEMMSVLAGEFGQKYFADSFLQNQNVRLLDQWPQSPRLLISTKPVRSLSDLSGLKLRTPAGIPTWETGWTKLGAMTVSLALDEAFTACQQGVCDGVEMPLDFIYNYHFQDVCKYLTMTEHIRYVQMILINEDSWNKISPEDQEVVAQCIKEAGEYATQLRNDKEQDMYNDMKTTSQVEIISLTDAQRQEFADAVSGLYSENMSIWGQEAYDDLMDALKVYRGK